ncbi:hypothetical protein [Altericroceibacterium xinjiangense]|uniref:hypothetical protein n=1 Tax=Altericroceibacterium xinjiangense TaxID=762261 RepID=UPI000F7D92F1|nr:hypothetical protein [Altericroceibacterium xinjiangense]
MAVFGIGFILCALASIGARDRPLVARLSARLGTGAALPCAICLAVLASSALAGWAASLVVPAIVRGLAPVLAAVSLVLGAVQLIALRPRRVPEEPTRSFGAIFLVLLAGQAFDPARLAIFGLAVWTGDTVAATLGGVLGSGIALTATADGRAASNARLWSVLAASVLIAAAGAMAFGARPFLID